MHVTTKHFLCVTFKKICKEKGLEVINLNQLNIQIFTHFSQSNCPILIYWICQIMFQLNYKHQNLHCINHHLPVSQAKLPWEVSLYYYIAVFKDYGCAIQCKPLILKLWKNKRIPIFVVMLVFYMSFLEFESAAKFQVYLLLS